MSYKIHTIFIATIISSMATHGSEHTKLYRKDDLRTTIENSIINAQNCYENKEYTQAALFARGAREYATINKMPLHIEDNIVLHYITADCHINLKSPQHAFESFQAIHDIETPYGTICSKTISECLYKKSHAVAQTQEKLSERLNNEAYNYTIKNLYHNVQQKSSLLTNNKLISQCAAFTDKQSKLRKCFFNFLDNSAITNSGFLKTLFNLESDTQFADTISLFVNSDGKYIMPLLQEQLLNTSQNNACNIHYVLGLLYYHQKKYAEAFSHLTQKTQYYKDLPTACKVLQAYCTLHTEFSQENVLEAFEIMKRTFQQKQQTPRNNTALKESLYSDLLYQHAFQCAQVLIENNHYQQALHLALFCLQHDTTYDVGLEIITIIHKKLISSSVDSSLLLNSQEFKYIKEYITQENDTPSLQCIAPIIVHALLQKQISVESLNKTLVIFCIEHSLNHMIHTPQETAALKKIVGDIYHQMKKVEKAYEYDHVDTILNKASTLFGGVNSGIERNEATLLIMCSKLLPLTEPHNKKDVRKKAADFLLSPSFIAPINDKEDSLINDKDKFVLMNIAYELGSDNPEHLTPLARNYMYGPQADYKKASDILERALKTAGSPKTRFELAKAYYLQGPSYYKKAFENFKIMAYTHDKTCEEDEKSLALLYMSLIKLHELTPESIMDAAHYLDNATPLEAVFTRSLGELMSEQLYKKVASYAQKQIEQQNTKDYALEACALFGQLFYERQEVTENTRHHLRHQTLASQCLEYAANNHNYRAQMTAVIFNDENIHNYKKIKYIHTILENTQQKELHSMFQYLNAFLVKYYPSPSQIKEKYAYLQYLKDHATEKALHSYLASEYFGLAPLKDHPEYATTDNELAKLLYEDTLLTTYRNEFNSFYDDKNNLKEKNPLILKRVIHVIYIYSYALMKSDDPKLITISASYINKLQQLPDYQNEDILKALLSTCYYRLSTRIQIPQLSFGYLQKSANLDHEQAVIDITNLWLKNDPYSKNIQLKQLLDWLKNARSEENATTIDQLSNLVSAKVTNDEDKEILFYCNLFSSENGLQQKKELIEQENAKTSAKEVLSTLTQTTHPHFKHLAATHMTPEAQNATFQSLLKNINDISCEQLVAEFLVLANQNHPHAALEMCILIDYKKAEDLWLKYFDLALKNGITQKGKKDGLCSDGLLLNLLCKLTVRTVDHKNFDLLRYIKKQLKLYKINIGFLTEYIHSLTNYDLNQHQEWKQ